jgi:hypothetical protein
MRPALVIILIIGVFLVPWWFMTAVLLLSVVLRRHFFLALIPAVLLDIIHGGAHFIDAPLSSATLLVSLALLMLSFLEVYLRDNVRI